MTFLKDHWTHTRTLPRTCWSRGNCTALRLLLLIYILFFHIFRETRVTCLCLKCVQPYFMWFLSLFSTVKPKLGHSFSQFTLGTKLTFLNVGLRLYFFLIHKNIEKWDFLILLSIWAFWFLPIHERDGKLEFVYIY